MVGSAALISFFTGFGFAGNFGASSGSDDLLIGSISGDICLRGQNNVLMASGGSTPRLRISATGNYSYIQPGITSGSPTGFLFTGGSHTTLDAAVESISFDVNTSATVQFTGGGSWTYQRATVFHAPTYAFTADTTLPIAATVAITGSPASGSHANITSPIALWIQGGTIPILIPQGGYYYIVDTDGTTPKRVIGLSNPTRDIEIGPDGFRVHMYGVVTMSSGVNLDGDLSMGNNTYIRTSNTGTLNLQGLGSAFLSGNPYATLFLNMSDTSTSGTIFGLTCAPTFNPTSGTASLSVWNLAPTINQTGGANGITRGLFINPTVTAAADWRSLEVKTGKATGRGIVIKGAASQTANLFECLDNNNNPLVTIDGSPGSGLRNPFSNTLGGDLLLTSGNNVYVDNGCGILAKNTSGSYLRLVFLDGANTYGARNEGTEGSAVYGCAHPSNTTGSVVFQLQGNNASVISPYGNWSITQLVQTSGSPAGFLFTGANHTTLDARECITVNWNLAQTIQFSVGDVSVQRSFVIQAQTLAYTGASTIGIAATLAITGAPNPGLHATLTESYALWSQNGNVQFDGTGGSHFSFSPRDGSDDSTLSVRSVHNAVLQLEASDGTELAKLYANSGSDFVIRSSGRGMIFFISHGGDTVAMSLNAVAGVPTVSFYNASPVVQPSAITAPSGGAIQDAEARTTITSILNAIGAAAGGIGITA